MPLVKWRLFPRQTREQTTTAMIGDHSSVLSLAFVHLDFFFYIFTFACWPEVIL